MKSFIKVVLALFILTSLGFSNPKLEERKDRILNKIDRRIEFQNKRIELLKQHRGCILNSRDNKSIRECKEKYKIAVKDLKNRYKKSKESQKRHK